MQATKLEREGALRRNWQGKAEGSIAISRWGGRQWALRSRDRKTKNDEELRGRWRDGKSATRDGRSWGGEFYGIRWES